MFFQHIRAKKDNSRVRFYHRNCSRKRLCWGIGGTIETKLTKHSGIKSGIFFRPYKRDFTVLLDQAYYNYIINEQYLSFPFLYKFYSKTLNFSIGPTFDFLQDGHKKEVAIHLRK